MIVAIILADRTTNPSQGMAPYFLPPPDATNDSGEETLLERVAATVLRGPFGGVIVAAAKEHSAAAKEVLNGFAVQHLQVAGSGAHSAVAEALAFAAAFRARWEKAMAAAGQRFSSADEDDEEDEDDNDDDGEDAVSPKAKAKNKPPASKAAKKEEGWTRHSQSPDVKIRGLARSFDRDGVILFRAERPVFRPELQARVVEAFGREGTERAVSARPLGQAVYQGQRGYPVILSLDAAREIAALPASTLFDDWLLQQLARIQDISVDDAAAISQ